ncbi:U3 small nucleolar RNA-associated protein Utp11 [Aspergillus bombycis]|uniref:U3 small nucleolar RNA-associated protein Utp11 n=1 Tax=Aspergillus bombycis TaxID=109264 RepID=A0A1F8AEJ8_9EURO|nr:U3 small nucleolar RNA-associated protein Utp11 [Aspergillus bombycis]OGM50087.1 U3 small nucleolar RNA-associated protein Utp11 [Aspergillus bombycis]
MSSMRNAVQRRNHKERGQIQGREKWGILEKHKDYSLRAKDYNQKKAKLKRLEEKVRDRNPDEFAFGMMSSHSQKAGKHGTASRDSAAGLSHDAIKLLKTQDAGYLRTTGERIRRQMDKLEQEIQLQDGMVQSLVGKRPKKKKAPVRDEGDDELDFDFDEESEEEEEAGPKKTVFADDKLEQRALKMKRVQEEGADEEREASFGDLQRKKTARELEADRLALQEARRARKIKQRAHVAKQNKLAALQKQHNDITAAERQLDWQRGRMDNAVGGTNKNGIKWKIRERKK